MTRETLSDSDLKAYKEYIESLDIGDLNYVVTFKTYTVINKQEDIDNHHPVRIGVSLYAECPVSYIDTAFVKNCKEFFEEFYGEMVIESGNRVESFSNIKELKASQFPDHHYVFVGR